MLYFKTLIYSLFFTSLCFNTLYSDGPPINDKGEVTTDHITLQLSKEQIKQVGVYRQLSFSKEQMKLISKLEKKFPPLINIITPNYNDCSCGLENYGVWIKKNQIAIPTYQFIYFTAQENLKKNKKNTAAIIKLGTMLHMNAKGSLFNQGSRVSFESIDLSFQKLKKEEDPYVFISIPPKIDSKIDLQIKNFMEKIFSLSKKHKVKIYIQG